MTFDAQAGDAQPGRGGRPGVAGQGVVIGADLDVAGAWATMHLTGVLPTWTNGVLNNAILQYGSHPSQLSDRPPVNCLPALSGLTLMVALVAATVAITGGATLNRLGSAGIGPPMLAAVAIIYCLLAGHALHAELRIGLAARYIHSELRSQFHDLTGVEVWRWDAYLNRQRRRDEPAGLDDRLISVLDWTRWLVYVIPMAGSLLAFAAVPSLRAVPAWQFSFGVICLALAVTVGLVAACKPGFPILR